MKHTIETGVINTTEQIGSLVDWLVLRHAPPAPGSPTMYIDLEGSNLCRKGSLSILTLLIDTGTPIRKVHLVDVHTLGAKAFNTAGVRGKTLKDILEAEKIPKVFFDVRNGSDALFAHFGVALQGVEDVQLMESATRTTTASRKFLSDLAKFIEQNVFMAHGSDQASWKQANEKGERLFKAEHGGSYDVFNQRPIPGDIVSYCVSDVQYLPKLRDRFWRAQPLWWRELVSDESMKRVSASQKPDYQPHGSGRTVSPWNKEQNRVLDQWSCTPARNYIDEAFSLYEDWYDGQDDDGDFDWDNRNHNDFED